MGTERSPMGRTSLWRRRAQRSPRGPRRPAGSARPGTQARGRPESRAALARSPRAGPRGRAPRGPAYPAGSSRAARQRLSDSRRADPSRPRGHRQSIRGAWANKHPAMCGSGTEASKCCVLLRRRLRLYTPLLSHTLPLPATRPPPPSFPPSLTRSHSLTLTHSLSLSLSLSLSAGLTMCPSQGHSYLTSSGPTGPGPRTCAHAIFRELLRTLLRLAVSVHLTRELVWRYPLPRSLRSEEAAHRDAPSPCQLVHDIQASLLGKWPFKVHKSMKKQGGRWIGK